MTQEQKEKLEKAFDVYESFQSDFDYTSRHTQSFAQRSRGRPFALLAPYHPPGPGKPLCLDDPLFEL